MPSPIFDAPLTSTLVPTTAGNPAFTFSRATTAYATGVAAGGNAVDGQVLILCDAGEPRFHGARRISANNWSATYADGSAIPAATLLGYVAENAATNLCLQSQTFDSGTWTKGAATITANTQTAPDGTLTADTFTDDATSGLHRTYQTSISYLAATVYTISVYFKGGTLPWIQVEGFHTSGSVFSWANFNTLTGAIGNKAAGVTATIVALPNGWYRGAITFTAGADASGYIMLNSMSTDQNVSNPAYVGTGQTMYLWGAQVETGSDPTSYIPTTTVAVVRNVDSLTYPVTSNIDGALATTYMEAYLPVAQTTSVQAGIYMATSAKYAQDFAATTKVLSMDGTAAISTANARTLGAVNRGASAWGAGTASIVLNGGAVATGAFTAYTTSGNVSIGAGGAGTSIQGSIRNVKFYATRLTDAQLIQLTTDGFLPPDIVPVVPSTEGGIGARVRRYRRIEVEIDGEIFPVASEEEGRELLLKAREAAKQAAQAAAVRAAAKAEKKTSPAAVERALALSTPRISLRADDRSEALAQAIQSQVDAAQAAIDEDYATARRMAYAYVRQRLQDEQRQRELAADEEEVIAMILRLP